MNTASTTPRLGKFPVRRSVTSAIYGFSTPSLPPDPLSPRRPSPFSPFPVRRAQKQIPSSSSYTGRCFCCLDFSVFGISHMGGFQGRNLGQTAAMPLRAGESCGEESLDVFPC